MVNCCTLAIHLDKNDLFITNCKQQIQFRDAANIVKERVARATVVLELSYFSAFHGESIKALNE